MNGKTSFPILIIVALLMSCQGSLKQALTKDRPYEEYVKSLEKAQLDQTPMAQSWLAAGQQALQDSIIVDLPFSESGYFSAAEPTARSYRFQVHRGQVLTISGMARAPQHSRLFLDLFVRQDNSWKHIAQTVALADSSFQFSEEFSDTQQCLLRIQPELLINAYYTLTLSPTPVLINPVSGATNRSIGSLFGADRDGGKRRHEGIDIFAAKGTPIVAPTAGMITRVNTTPIGGKVVWMQDRARGHAYYFAHLDSQLVVSGQRVMQGDTLGLVGNTGNAKTTPPHLHFGIYARGSIDPIHFVRTLDIITETAQLDTAIAKSMYRISAKQANLRQGPGEDSGVVEQLEQDTYVQIVAQTGEWFRVELPNQQRGFVSKKLISPVTIKSTRTLPQQMPLLTAPDSTAIPLDYLKPAASVEVLATFGQYELVQTKNGTRGWLQP